MRLLIAILVLAALSGCASIKYYNMQPSEARRTAEFVGNYYSDEIDGYVSILVKLIDDPVLKQKSLFFWVVNKGERPIEFNYLVDKIRYEIEGTLYAPEDHNTILDYPKLLNPGSYLQHGTRKAIRIPREHANKITGISWEIWSIGQRIRATRENPNS